jgi:hypothetical protein
MGLAGEGRLTNNANRKVGDERLLLVGQKFED